MKLRAKVATVAFCLLWSLLLHDVHGNVHDLEGNDLGHSNGERQDPNRHGTGRGFADSARDLLTSPAGQLAVSFAKEMISRSAGNTQVLSLNLTNLLILFLLKALIFSAGLIGAGNWGQYARGRSEKGTGSGFFQEGEANLMIGYLAAEGSGQDGCMMRSACQVPHTANEYARAAHALIKGAEMFDPELPKNLKYKRFLLNLDRAVMEGLQGAPCDMIYPCHL